MKTKNLKYQIQVVFLKEGSRFIAYSPALDLSTSGITKKQAKERFQDAVNIFFEELESMGTTERALSDLGWIKQKSIMIPPTIIGQITESFKVAFA
jgi:hypothetical protein